MTYFLTILNWPSLLLHISSQLPILFALWTLWYVGKCLTTDLPEGKKKKRKLRYIIFAHTQGVNAPAMANLTWCHRKWCWDNMRFIGSCEQSQQVSAYNCLRPLLLPRMIWFIVSLYLFPFRKIKLHKEKDFFHDYHWISPAWSIARTYWTFVGKTHNLNILNF